MAGTDVSEKDVVARAKEGSQVAYAVIARQYTQAGFANALDGIGKSIPPRYYSFAALAVQGGSQAGFPASWIAAFDLGNNYAAMIVVRDGLVAPSGGDIGGTVEDVQERFAGVASQGGWGRIFAPASWSIPNAVELDFDALCAEAYSPRARIKATRPSPVKNIVAIAAILGIAGAAYGYTVYADMNKKRQLLLARLAAEAAEKAEADAKLAKAKEALLVPHPTKKVPPARDFIFACMATMREFPITISGWERTSLKCEIDGVMAEYSRVAGAGTVEQLLRIAPSAAPTFDGQSAKIAKLLPLSGPFDESRALPAEKSVLGITSALQRATTAGWITGFIPLAESKEPPAATLPGAAATAAAAVATWRTFSFSTVGAVPPTSLAGLFEFNGVRVTKITMTTSANREPPSYLINGELYADKS
jgi:hypothetical protein